MNLREDALEMVNADLRMMVNMNIFSAEDHIERMDHARSLKIPQLIHYMGKTHNEVFAYMLDFNVYQEAS